MNRPIHLVSVEARVRPAVILTREPVRHVRDMLTVAITSRVRGLATEVAVGPANGIDHESVIMVDNIATIPAVGVGRLLGYLTTEQERAVADAIVTAFDLDI